MMVLSVHWSTSTQILFVHVSSKVMNENSLNKIPVCSSVCLLPQYPHKICSQLAHKQLEVLL